MLLETKEFDQIRQNQAVRPCKCTVHHTVHYTVHHTVHQEKYFSLLLWALCCICGLCLWGLALAIYGIVACCRTFGHYYLLAPCCLGTA